ncbi:universal stress protein [Mucilaginibacter boryungensis]|uniref:Universal stress protein n=1 Tax=Mucilaginibacter boryungensis TaxID=768480 RepID=A0ABR9XE69_9SPHI|nr:universal stress protein [Mucilaginibacter boryungensis]MBE9665688.1 universal stress protein [Mucilaginibacter boryungensis]
MKKISAAFDGLKFSKATLDYAIDLTKHSQAILTGVFLEDFLYHSFNLYDMVGSEGISSTKLKRLMDKDKVKRQDAVQLFKKACSEKKVNYIVHQDESFAINDLLKESIYGDLVLIGAQETMNHFQQDKPTPFVKDLLASSQCPVLVVPGIYRPIDRVTLLYDGRPSSVYAIKMFNYLFPWLSKTPVEVVFAQDDDKSTKLPDELLFKELIACYYPQVNYKILKGEPEKALLSHLQNLSSNNVVVMGAYSRGTVSRMFSASMANRLMEALDVPMFIAHK